jgi:hypothetical protein
MQPLDLMAVAHSCGRIPGGRGRLLHGLGLWQRQACIFPADRR